MSSLFTVVLDLSLQASWIIVAVCVLRKVLYRAPKWIRLVLWGIVAFRLICPLTFRSPVSLVPQHQVSSVVSSVSSVHEVLPSSAESVSSVSPGIDLSILWIAGILTAFCIALMQYRKLKTQLKTAVLYQDNIYRCEFISTPFVLGISRPHIYLPYGMEDREMKYVLDHEKEHIHHGDHILKPLGYVLVCIHWFNPLVWLGWYLFGKDLELACDERAVSRYTGEEKADYSEAMLACASGTWMVCPLGFGETGVKERVKAVMNYRKPSFWAVSGCIVACLITAVCFLSQPVQKWFYIKITVPASAEYGYYMADEQICPQRNKITVSMEAGNEDCQVVLQRLGSDEIEITSYLTAGMETEMQVEKDVWYRIGLYMENSTADEKVYTLHVKPVALQIEDTGLEQYRTEYVGDSSGSAAIAMSLPYPDGYTYDHIALQTDAEPYEMTVYLNGTGTYDFQTCADTAFDLIGNLGIITFCNTDDTVYASYARHQ